jgi:hypothetical protein
MQRGDDTRAKGKGDARHKEVATSPASLLPLVTISRGPEQPYKGSSENCESLIGESHAC